MTRAQPRANMGSAMTARKPVSTRARVRLDNMPDSEHRACQPNVRVRAPGGQATIVILLAFFARGPAVLEATMGSFVLAARRFSRAVSAHP